MDQLKHLIEVWTSFAQGLTGSIGALAFVCAFIWMRADDRDAWTNSCSSFNRASYPWPRTGPRTLCANLVDDEFRPGFQSESSDPINCTQGEHHGRYLHVRRLFQPGWLRLQ